MLKVATGDTFQWDAKSTYVRKPPFFDDIPVKPAAPTDITGARCLAILGDSVTTDHISPAGDISAKGPAGKYLREHQVPVTEFNSYGARRGNHEVMMRGTFANIRIKNEIMGGKEGGVTKHFPDGEELSIYDAAMKYEGEKRPLVIFAGKEYGTGSSRDWAAKGTMLLGVKAVICESFERIHRSNLVGMGVLPLQFMPGEGVASIGLTGDEVFEFGSLLDGAAKTIDVVARGKHGEKRFKVQVLPATTTAADALKYKPAGIFLSNGPGDPSALGYAVNTVRDLIASGLPIFGICLGHQILGHQCTHADCRRRKTSLCALAQ